MAGKHDTACGSSVACRSYLRCALAPAVSSGLSWNLVKSYRGASSKQASITEMVTSTERPACVLVSLHMAIEGRAKGRGRSSDNPNAPSIAQKTNKGIAKPNIFVSGCRTLFSLFSLHTRRRCDYMLRNQGGNNAATTQLLLLLNSRNFECDHQFPKTWLVAVVIVVAAIALTLYLLACMLRHPPWPWQTAAAINTLRQIQPCP